MDHNRLSRAVDALVDLVAQLRAPGGCPWDAKQTDSTIKLYLLEEAYEVLEAVENSSPSDVCQELGDLFFHILFLAQLAEERGEFDFTEVVERVSEKMIRRHPHVFGQTSVKCSEDVAMNWARIKKDEQEQTGNTFSDLNGVPKHLPALLRAHRLGERASKAGFGISDANEAWDKVQESFEGLRTAIASEDKYLFGREMGAFLFGLVNFSRLWGLNSENLLRIANKAFQDGFEKKEHEW